MKNVSIERLRYTTNKKFFFFFKNLCMNFFLKVLLMKWGVTVNKYSL